MTDGEAWEAELAGIGVPVDFWAVGDARDGAFVDWPGCPLVMEASDEGPVVRAHIGSGGDHCPDADDDLDDIVSGRAAGHDPPGPVRQVVRGGARPRT